jgi:hypothetical protein
MTRHWKAYWVFFGTGSTTIPSASRSKKTTTPTRADRRRGWFVLRPACLPEGWRSSYVSSDSRHRPQSARVQHRCPGRARQYRACQPGVSLKATRLVSSTGRPAVGSAAKHREVRPGRPQPGLEDVAAVLRGQAGPALYSIYLSHNERNPIGLLSLYMQQQAFARFGSRMGLRRRGTPLMDYEGKVTMGSTGIPLVGRTRRVGGHLSVALSFKHCES